MFSLSFKVSRHASDFSRFPLAEYIELGEIEGLEGENVEFTMVEDIYDEFAARHHVQHIRSILVSPPSYASSLGAVNVTPTFLRSDKESVEELAKVAKSGAGLSSLSVKEKPEAHTLPKIHSLPTS